MGNAERQIENKFDTERELARKLLQRCSDLKSIPPIYGKFFFLRLYFYIYLKVMYMIYNFYRYKQRK